MSIQPPALWGPMRRKEPACQPGSEVLRGRRKGGPGAGAFRSLGKPQPPRHGVCALLRFVPTVALLGAL